MNVLCTDTVEVAGSIRQNMKTIFDKFKADLLSGKAELIDYDNCEIIIDSDGDVCALLEIWTCQSQCGGTCGDCRQLISLT